MKKAARTAGKANKQSPTDLSYGPHERQGVDFFSPAQPSPTLGERPPLIAFVHGGGWSFGNRTQTNHYKPAYFTQQGYAYASIGYRVLPEAEVEEQAKDVARGLRHLREQAETLGFDPDRIVLMGHSAGAHLAALVSTDPQYAGEDLAAIAGVILLDGAGYDVAENMRIRGRASRIYDRAFGSDPDRQATLSPISHVASPHAPEWLVLHVAGLARSQSQSVALGDALIGEGASAEVVAISNSDHGRMNRELGNGSDNAAPHVARFLARLFGS